MGICSIACVFVVTFAILTSAKTVNGLELDFYQNSCPHAEQIVKATVNDDFRQNSSDVIPALIRLAFHDCFVEGCDASVLLDSVEGKFVSEKETIANANSLQGYDLIDVIKEKLEAACPQTVSCADIIVLSARDAIAAMGGPYIRAETGRRDSTSAYAREAEKSLNPTGYDEDAVSAFQEKGFTEKDVVSLLGAHTIGKSPCRFFQSRLTNFNGTGRPDPTIDVHFRGHLTSLCSHPGDPSVALDDGSPTSFDNNYYKNLISGKGLLSVDQALMASPSSRALVEAYAFNRTLFNHGFSQSLLKLFNYKVLTGNQGQIRKDCSKLVV